jgi:hypothetical protein
MHLILPPVLTVAAGKVDRGELVIVEGKISAKNRILVHDFVDAAKEYQAKGGSWTILEVHRQPVLADLARGEILLTSDTLCTEWNRKVRYVGLKRGDPVTAIGTLASLAPAALTVKYWYSGSVADYKIFLSSSRRGLHVFCGVIAIVGAGLFLLGLKRK